MFSVAPSLWGSGEFAPDQLSNLMGWYDASDAATITYGVSPAVVGWADKSPYGNDLAGNGNIDSSGTYLSKNCMYFTGTQSLDSTISAPDIVGGYTAFVVNYWPAGAGPNSQVYSSSGPDIFSGPCLALYSYTSGGHDYVGMNGGQSFGTDYALSPDHAQSAGIHQLTWRFGTTVSTNEIFIDGVSQSLTFGGTTSHTNNVVFLGISKGQSVWQGRLGEFLFYNRRLTDTEVSLVEAYLQAKWGTP